MRTSKPSTLPRTVLVALVALACLAGLWRAPVAHADDTVGGSTFPEGPYAVLADLSGLMRSMPGFLPQGALQAGTIINLTSSRTDAAYGEPLRFTATVAPAAPSELVPTGLVQFAINGQPLGGPVALDAGGVAASSDINSLVPGIYTVTASYMGDPNYSPSGATMSQSVAKQSTTLTVQSSANPIVYGASVDITATVAPLRAGQIVPDGKVQFYLDNVRYGSAVALDSQGKATKHLPYQNLWPGDHSVTAEYAGNSKFTGSDNWWLAYHQIVQKVAPVITLSPTSANAVFGQPVTFAVAVAGTLATQPTPTGAVQLIVNGTPAGSPVSLDRKGRATFAALTPAGAGIYTIAVSYTGDDYFRGVPATEATSLTVNPASTTVTVTGFSPAAAVVGQPISVSAVVAPVAPGAGSPSGVVTIRAGSDQCTAVPSRGLWTCVLFPSSPGQPGITATFEGDANFSASATLAPRAGPAVSKASSTITVDHFSPAAPVAGETVTAFFMVKPVAPGSGSPTGTITLTAGTATCSTPVAGGSCQITPLHAGAHAISLAYTGDSNFEPAAGELSLAVGKAPTGLALASSADTSPLGAPVHFTATVTVEKPGSGDPTGQVRFSIDGAAFGGPVDLADGVAASQVITTLALGAHEVNAQYLGAPDFDPGSGTIEQIITATETTVVLESTLNPSPYGVPVTILASVAGKAPSQAVPGAGAVQFVIDGVDYGSPVEIDGQGRASKSLPYTALWVGHHTISANYLGATGFLPGSTVAPHLDQVVIDATPVVATVFSANPVRYGQAVVFTTTVAAQEPTRGTPSGTVQFSLDGQPFGNPVALNASGEATSQAAPVAAPGEHRVTVEYSGDDYFGPLTADAASMLTVIKSDAAVEVLTIEPPSPVTYQPITVTVQTGAVAPGSGTPTGTVHVALGRDGCDVTLAAGAGSCTFRPRAAGTTDLAVTYDGDENFNAAAATTTAFEVGKAAITGTLSADPATVAYNQPFTLTLRIAGMYGGVPTGTATFKAGGVTLCESAALSGGEAVCHPSQPLTATIQTLTAVYSGDDNFLNGSINHDLTITPAETEVTFSTSANPASYYQPITLTATVTGQYGGRPTGDITFNDNGQPVCAAAAVDEETGSATCLIDHATVGAHNIAVTYNGDTNYQASSSAPAAITVNAADTTLALRGDHSTAAFGESVTFTATVSGAFGGQPTGQVSFTAGESNICPAAEVQTDGAATCTISSLEVGDYVVSAAYTGDGNFNPSATGQDESLDLTVTKDQVQVALFSDVQPSTYYQPITLTATVSPTFTGVPTGTVTFNDGDAVLCAGVFLSPEGEANCRPAALAAGNHALTAVFSGDAHYLDQTSKPYSQTVTQAATTLVITASADSIVYFQPLTITATLSAAFGGTPTGAVTIRDGETVLCTHTEISSGQVTCSVPALPAGQHNIVAGYDGDANYLAAESQAVAVSVAQATAAAELSAAPNPAAYHQSVTITATLTGQFGGEPGGAVTFTEGAQVLCSDVAIEHATATCDSGFLPVGSHHISATFTGDDNYSAAPAAAVDLIVEQATTTSALTANGAAISFGQPLTLTATVSPAFGGTPTGTFTFYEGSTPVCSEVVVAGGQATCQVSDLSMGAHVFTAAYSGDTSFLGSTSAEYAVTVQKADTKVSLSGDHATAAYGETVTFTATVTSAFDGEPTGQVSFAADGAVLCAAVEVQPDGHATCTTASLEVGDYIVSAAYGGDGSFNPSATGENEAFNLTVTKDHVLVALTSDTNPAIYNQPITLTATVKPTFGGIPTGTVSISDGDTVLCAGLALSPEGVATCRPPALRARDHLLTATYSGDAHYLDQTSKRYTQTVNKAATTLTITGSTGSVVYFQPVTITVTLTTAFGGTPTGAISFTDGETVRCTTNDIRDGQATCTISVLTAGSHDIVAHYYGDDNYLFSFTQLLTQDVAKATSAAQLAADPNPSAYNQPIVITATLTGQFGGEPGGRVTFAEGAKVICANVNIAHATATCRPAALTVGNHRITATFTGDANYTAAPATSIDLNIQKAATSATIAASAAIVGFGQPVTLTATVTPAFGGAPAGSFTFNDGATPVCSNVPVTNGAASCKASALPIGAHAFTAAYSGDANYQGSSTLGVAVTVEKAAPNIMLAASSNPAPVGAAVAFTVTVSGGGVTPTGYVNFNLDGAALCPLVELVNGRASCQSSALPEGDHTLAVSYSGNASYTSGVPATLTQHVVSGAVVTVDPTGGATWNDPNGQPGTPGATSIVMPGGAVTETVTIVFRDLIGTTYTAPPGFWSIRTPLAIEVYANGMLQPGYQFARPVALTLGYDARSVDEDAVSMVTRSGNVWTHDGITTTGQDKQAHSISAGVLRAGEYGVVGRSKYVGFFPIILRPGAQQ